MRNKDMFDWMLSNSELRGQLQTMLEKQARTTTMEREGGREGEEAQGEQEGEKEDMEGGEGESTGAEQKSSQALPAFLQTQHALELRGRVSERPLGHVGAGLGQQLVLGGRGLG